MKNAKKMRDKNVPSSNKAAMVVRRLVAVSPESTSSRSPFCRAVKDPLDVHVIARLPYPHAIYCSR
jgi:hypothetical protein